MSGESAYESLTNVVRIIEQHPDAYERIKKESNITCLDGFLKMYYAGLILPNDSLDRIISKEDDSQTIGDIIPDKADVQNETESSILVESVREAVDMLPTLTRKALYLRFGFDNQPPMTSGDIAAQLGFRRHSTEDREYVRQLIDFGLLYLQEHNGELEYLLDEPEKKELEVKDITGCVRLLCFLAR